MICRKWTTGLVPERADVFDAYAKKVSLPMFKSQQGLLSCFVARTQDKATVTTIWENKENILAMERSAEYQKTVSGLFALSCLDDQQSVEIFDLREAYIRQFDTQDGLLPSGRPE